MHRSRIIEGERTVDKHIAKVSACRVTGVYFILQILILAVFGFVDIEDNAVWAFAIVGYEVVVMGSSWVLTFAFQPNGEEAYTVEFLNEFNFSSGPRLLQVSVDGEIENSGGGTVLEITPAQISFSIGEVIVRTSFYIAE